MDQVWQPGDRPAGTTTNKHARHLLAQRTALHRRRDGLGADLLHAWRCHDSCGSSRGARSIEGGKRPPALTDSRTLQVGNCVMFTVLCQKANDLSSYETRCTHTHVLHGEPNLGPLQRPT